MMHEIGYVYTNPSTDSVAPLRCEKGAPEFLIWCSMKTAWVVTLELSASYITAVYVVPYFSFRREEILAS
jgi:hypothetical protein